MSEFEALIPPSAVERLISAWEILLTEDRWSLEALNEFAELRGVAVFNTYADMVGARHDVRNLGSGWAVDDLRMQFGNRVPDPLLRSVSSDLKARALRPLTILAMSVRGVSGPRLIWHALTGR